MPASIAGAICAIMAKVDPARRGEHIEEGERQASYAGVDDVFQALQRHMAEAELICEFLTFKPMEWQAIQQGEQTLTALQMAFQVVLRCGEDVYANPNNIIEVAGIFEGQQTCNALRTSAERVYLRNLFKLPSIGAETPQAAQLQPGAPSAAKSAPEPMRGKKINNPIALSDDESAVEADKIIIAMTEAANRGDDIAQAVAEIGNAFKKTGGIFGRLQPADQSRIKQKNKELVELVTSGKRG